MAVPSQKELNFMASFERFNVITPASPTSPPAPPFHNYFGLFPSLLPEIRSNIWQLTLPEPRILHIKPCTPPTTPPTYTASPASYGGSHPVALRVCHESRAETMRVLTCKFNAYWNLKEDVAYAECQRWRAKEAVEQVADMHVRGLWNGIQKVAVDSHIWAASGPEKCINLLRTTHTITHFFFILRIRTWHNDLVVPGQAWYLLDADSPEQTEFRLHRDWCRVAMRDQASIVDSIETDCETHEKEWRARGFQPVIEFKIIEGRAMEMM